jgi:hypothetical protein
MARAGGADLMAARNGARFLPVQPGSRRDRAGHAPPGRLRRARPAAPDRQRRVQDPATAQCFALAPLPLAGAEPAR